jgi:RNA polymerase sigma-70 factor, ECF subfamily
LPPREGTDLIAEVSTVGPDRGQISDLQDRRDRDLVDGVVACDRSAFGELYRRYAAAGFGLATRILGEQVLAEEVVQEVFLSVWRRAGGYDPARGSVRSWLFAQIHHRAVDVVRREEAERRRSQSNLLPVDSEQGVDDVIEEGWLRARREQVRDALATLSAEQRHVIELAYFRGLTQTQVAQATGVPLGTVKSRTLAAMRRLRQGLMGAAVEDGWITEN